ncbi:hypothetical protein CBR_g29587 [Chara braunii]|uniref:JmjC domain-containing protein n=1 Tax=Chara braunii TaxID=69332 RepID=A0A388LAU7_CHABU|nr:hypothetical protein CBR_g29587 [Chara braunii]|eukprot:GBG79440.1 hypothetical protein CBR_g29587 [Chara braunii]
MEYGRKGRLGMAAQRKRRVLGTRLSMARGGAGEKKGGKLEQSLEEVTDYSQCNGVATSDWGDQASSLSRRQRNEEEDFEVVEEGVEEEEEEEEEELAVGGSRFDLERGAHPLGVRPLGNLLFDVDAGERGVRHNVRDVGLGDLAILSDATILDIVGHLSGRDLARLALVSKAFYVFCYQDDTWRALVVEELRGDFRFAGSWRETYRTAKDPSSYKLAAAYAADGRKKGNRDNFSLAPLRVKGFYSDYLFQSWLCASLSIKDEWLRRDNIVRRRWPDLTVEEFVEKFEVPNRPVLISGLTDDWPAVKLWDRDYLLSQASACGAKFACGPVDMRLDDFYVYADRAQEERPIYLFDPKFGEKVPQLARDYEVPGYFAEDLFSVLGPEGRPHYRWLIIGPARSGSSFHIDPNCTSAWNAVVRGSKKWVLYPPEMVPPGVHPSADGADVTSPVSITEWFMNFYHLVSRDMSAEGERGGGGARNKAATQRRPVECVCREGEVVFVPRGWWHIVLNLEDSVAVTQNYVSRQNLLQVLDFLRSPNAKVVVSGTDRRESLHDEFRSKFEEFHPGVIAHLEEKARQKAAKASKMRSFWDSVADVNSQTGGFKFGF